MTILQRGALAAIVAVVLTALLVAPSQADSRTRTDPRGDAVAHFDLTSATYINARKAIHVELRARNLKGIVTVAGVRFNASFMGSSYFYVSAARYPGGEIRYGLYSVTPNVSDDHIPCPGLKVRWSISQEWVRFTIPQFCLGEGGRARHRFTSRLGDVVPKDWTRRIAVSYR